MALPTFETAPCDALLLHASTRAVLEGSERSALVSVLSVAERERLQRFHFDDDRDTYLVAHALVRRGLAAISGAPAQTFEFSTGEHGRPELAGPPELRALRFNLSHTRGHVACAFTRGADVGVDLESAGRTVDLWPVAERVFSDEERAGLSALPADRQRARFFELWTLKEAYIKAIGKGFSAPLRDITFRVEHPDPVPLVLGASIADDASSYACRRFSAGAELPLAIVWRGADPHAVRSFAVAASDLAA